MPETSQHWLGLVVAVLAMAANGVLLARLMSGPKTYIVTRHGQVVEKRIDGFKLFRALKGKVRK